ncbi:MAG: glycosyltransferase [Muribaculaceae bacterium]|nr:glycosyltransferase [Muribaculaceae bacterium]
MYLSFSMNIYTISCLIISIISAIVLLIWYPRRFNIIFKATNASADKEPGAELPAVSVIIYTCNDAANLRQLIYSIMNQNYDSEYEVVVVDDGSSDSTQDLLTELSFEYSNLYHTFIPKGTLNLSRKKLALTLGIKAAKYDIILTTSGNCSINSNNWITSMMSSFNDDVDIVLGYSYSNYKDDNGIGKCYRSFDEVFNSVQYLSYALRGKPYRGDGNNLAYRKKLFFENKGFSKTLNLHYGEDDLFINEIATGENTKVQLNSDSQVEVFYDDVKDAFKELKLRYDFTQSYLHTMAKHTTSVITIVNYLFVCSLICCSIVALPSILPAIICIILFLLVVVINIIFYRRAALVLNSRKLMFSLPIFLMLRPFVNMQFHLIGRYYRKSNFTWQRIKMK